MLITCHSERVCAQRSTIVHDWKRTRVALNDFELSRSSIRSRTPPLSLSGETCTLIVHSDLSNVRPLKTVAPQSVCVTYTLVPAKNHARSDKARKRSFLVRCRRICILTFVRLLNRCEKYSAVSRSQSLVSGARLHLHRKHLVFTGGESGERTSCLEGRRRN